MIKFRKNTVFILVNKQMIIMGSSSPTERHQNDFHGSRGFVYLGQKFEDMPRSKFPMDYENGPEDGSFVAHSLHLKSKENEGSVLETHW